MLNVYCHSTAYSDSVCTCNGKALYLYSDRFLWDTHTCVLHPPDWVTHSAASPPVRQHRTAQRTSTHIHTLMLTSFYPVTSTCYQGNYGPWKSLEVLEFKMCWFNVSEFLENDGGPWKFLNSHWIRFVAFGKFLSIESLTVLNFFEMLLWILVTLLLLKDYLLRNTLGGIFCYYVKVRVMILLQRKNDCM